MPRRKLIRQNEFPYHVTSRSRNQEWYQVNLDLVWRFSLDSLSKAKEKAPCKVHSFVLMNNHYHLILTPEDGKIDSFMYEFNKNLSLRIRNETRRINQIFGGRYKWLILNRDHLFMNFLRYVYRNPVKAGIAHRCENYRYSSLYLKMQKYKYNILLRDESIFHSLYSYDRYHLDWFNRSPEEIEDLAIELSLKKLGHLKISKTSNNREIKLQRFVA